jgi:non-specific protein-tyrosine kinase
MDLVQYSKGILRWWWLILLSTGIAAAASYYASLQQPRIYQTATTLIVGQVIQKTDLSGSDFQLSEQLAESYAQIAVRQPVLQATVDSLGLDMGWQRLQRQVYAYPIPRTQLLAITVNDISPERAVAIADEIAYQLILQSPGSPENQPKLERSEFVRSQLDDLELRIQRTQSRIKDVQTELESAFSARQIQDLQTEISNLETLVNTWQANYADLLSFLEGGEGPNRLTVIEPAQLSTSPVSPNVAMNVLLAVAVGFVLAVAAAMLLEYIDDTVKTADDLSRTLNLIPLGSVSRISGKEYKDKLITMHDLFSPEAEAYRLIRTNLQFRAVDQPPKTLMITSPNSNEGKSTTASNLAAITAQTKLRTILIDADLRRPSLHHIFQIPNSGGLTELLSSPEFEVENQLKKTDIENLQVITSGPLPPNPSELLGSKRMAELLDQLEKIADVIILDSSPVLAVTDATVLSKMTDGVILVTLAKRTRRDAVRQALRRFEQVGANVLGAVVNQVSGSRKYATSYTHSVQARMGQPKLTTSRRWWQRFLPVFK